MKKTLSIPSLESFTIGDIISANEGVCPMTVRFHVKKMMSSRRDGRPAALTQIGTSDEGLGGMGRPKILLTRVGSNAHKAYQERLEALKSQI